MLTISSFGEPIGSLILKETTSKTGLDLWFSATQFSYHHVFVPDPDVAWAFPSY
jgi:hypothetical protein